MPFSQTAIFYIDDETQHGFLIDPGADAQKLLQIIAQNQWTIEKILLTHGHFDHFAAAPALRQALNCDILASRLADQYLLNPRMNLSVFCQSALTLENTIACGEDRVVPQFFAACYPNTGTHCGFCHFL